MTASVSVSELARIVYGVLTVPSEQLVSRIARLDQATSNDVSFLPHRHLRSRLNRSRAAAVIIDAASKPFCEIPAIVVRDPLLGFALAAQRLPLARGELWLDQNAKRRFQVHRSAEVHPSAIVEVGANIGAFTKVGAGAVVGAGVRIGDYCTIGPNATLIGHTTVGNRVVVGPATVIGNEPFVYVRDGDIWHRVPSFAEVSINDDVDIGAHCTLDRGVLKDSEIGRGVKLDSHVHVGHDVIIGANSALAAGASIGGGVSIGEACLLGGGVGIAEGLRIANRVRVTAMSMVTKSIRESGTSYSSGWPARPSREWWRGAARLNQLAASAPSPVIEVLVDE